MFDLISSILAWLYSVWPSFGGSIALLTLGVMIIVTPLTLAGTKSMIKMQRLQPDLKAVQEYYKDDKELQNQQVMAFYQANGINPVGGCLPLFIQAPVFIVLYQVIRGVTRRVDDVGLSSGFGAGLRNGGVDPTLVEGIEETQRFNPQYLDEGTELFQDLSSRTDMPFLRVFDLADTALDVIGRNFIEGLPYIILILVVGALGFYQQRQIQGRQRPGAVINPQQQMIMKFMPFFLPVISFNLQAALVVYFLVSNLYRILQQGYITRALYGNSEDGQIEVIYPEGFDPKNVGKKKKKKKKASADGGSASSNGSKNGASKNGASKNGAGKSGSKTAASSNGSNGSSSNGSKSNGSKSNGSNGSGGKSIRPAAKSNGSSGKAGRISGGVVSADTGSEASGALGGLFGSKKEGRAKASSSSGTPDAKNSKSNRGSENSRVTPKGTVSPRPRSKKKR